MLVLEYALQEFNISFADLAKELGIDRSNITIWLSGKRPIPKKYLPLLSAKLKIPQEWLSQELTKLKKLEIDNIKLKNQIHFEEIEDTFIDENGEEVKYMRDVEVSGVIDVLQFNESLVMHEKALLRLNSTLDTTDCDCIEDATNKISEHALVINMFSEIMESKKLNQYTFKKILSSMHIYLQTKKGFGKLYNYDDDKFVKQLVKLISKEEEKQIENAKEWNELFDNEY